MDGSDASPMVPCDEAAAGAHADLAWAALAALLVAGALAAVLADDGIVVTPQSMQLLAAADGLVHGEGYNVSAGNLLTRYPPLYATLIAPLAALGLAPIPAAVVVNALGFALGLFGVYGLARQARFSNPLWVAAAFALLASNYYFLRSARPDGWMTSLSVIAAWAALVYCERGTRASFLGLIAASAAATLARYMAAFSLLPVLALFVLWASAGRRWRDALVYLAGAGAPLAAWLLRNRSETGFLFGMSRTVDRAPSADVTLVENFHGLFESVFLDGFAWQAMGARHIVFDGAELPQPALTMIGAAVGLIGLASAVAFVWKAGLRPSGLAEKRTDASGSAGSSARRGEILVASCAVAYGGALIAIWTSGNNDPINTRYAAPLYPFLVLSIAALAENLRAAGGGRLPRAGLVLFCIAVLLPNSMKSLSILSAEPPSRDLLEVTSRRGQHTNWKTSLRWARR